MSDSFERERQQVEELEELKDLHELMEILDESMDERSQISKNSFEVGRNVAHLPD